MLTLYPSFLERDGKKAFAVLPYEEFLAMEEQLENIEDLKTLRAAKSEESDAPTVRLSQVRKELGL